MNNFKVLMNGIVKENPTFVLLLGMCPTLGTTSSAINGMGMGLAVFKKYPGIKGVFLPLITTNCCILGVTILVIQKDFDLLTGVVYAFSTALGFALALIVFAGIREQLSLVNIPKGMRGMSIALVTAGLLAMAFMGFSGVDKGLSALFGIG
jgi:Na+-translocating ferredoxin:NAD+ oxidoreductase RnfA subunit